MTLGQAGKPAQRLRRGRPLTPSGQIGITHSEARTVRGPGPLRDNLRIWGRGRVSPVKVSRQEPNARHVHVFRPLGHRTDERRRPPFKRELAGIRDAIAPDLDRLAASVDGLDPCRCESGANEARDCVTIDPMDEYKQFLGGAVRTAGEQL
jgi:hypothetical protein